MTPEERQKRGLAGREWVLSNESNFTAKKMGQVATEISDEVLDAYANRFAPEFEKSSFFENEIVEVVGKNISGTVAENKPNSVILGILFSRLHISLNSVFFKP